MTLTTVGTDEVRESVDAALATLKESLRQVNHEVNNQAESWAFVEFHFADG